MGIDIEIEMEKNVGEGISSEDYLHVLQEVAEQVGQLVSELRRLLPPPIPKLEKHFCISLLLH